MAAHNSLPETCSFGLTLGCSSLQRTTVDCNSNEDQPRNYRDRHENWIATPIRVNSSSGDEHHQAGRCTEQSHKSES